MTAGGAVVTNDVLRIDAPTTWSGVTNVFTNAAVCGVVNADWTLRNGSFVRLTGGGGRDLGSTVHLATNANDVTVRIRDTSALALTYRNSASPAAWVQTGLSPANSTTVRSYIKLHVGVKDGPAGSTGRAQIVQEGSCSGKWGQNHFGSFWAERVYVHSSVSAGPDGFIDLLDLRTGAVADVAHIENENDSPVRILFRGGRILRNNATSCGTPICPLAGRSIVLAGTDGNEVHLRKQYQAGDLTGRLGGDVRFTGRTVRLSSAGFRPDWNPIEHNFQPWNLSAADRVSWEQTGDLVLSENCWLRCQSDDVLPASAANGGVVCEPNTSSDVVPGNAKTNVCYSCIDLCGTTQRVNAVTSANVTHVGYLAVITNSLAGRTGVLRLGTRDDDGALTATLWPGTEVWKEGAGRLTVSSAAGPVLRVKGGRVDFLTANPDIPDVFTNVEAAAGTVLAGDLTVRGELRVHGAAVSWPQCALTLAPGARIVLDDASATLGLSALRVGGRRVTPGEHGAADLPGCVNGRLVVRTDEDVWTPVVLKGPGTFDLHGEYAGLLAPLIATNGAEVIVRADDSLGPDLRPFTLYSATANNATDVRYLRFVGDRTVETPIRIKDATADLMDEGATLVLKGALSGFTRGTQAVGVNTNARLVIEGGLDTALCDRFFINSREGARTVVTNRPIVAYSGYGNELDLNTYGRVSATAVPVTELAVAGNAWRMLRIFGGQVRCAVPYALAPDGWIRFGRSDWTPQNDPRFMLVDLGGHDQRCGGLATDWFVADPSGKTYNPARYACVTSDAPATLTVTPAFGNSGENGVVYAAVRFAGRAGLTFAPSTVAPALTLANQVSDTAGALTVASGTLTFAQGAGWAGARDVTVRGSGTLAMDAASAANAFGPDGARTTLTLLDDGRLDIPAGVTVTVHNVVFDGVRAEAGTYGGEGSGAADCSHAAHFVPGGGVLRARLSAEAMEVTPETSRLFEPHVDAVSGVRSYILRRNLLDFHHQSFYFTARSMTDDGRFLLFNVATNEFWYGKTPSRRNAFIDFKTDTVHEFAGTSFYSPWLDVERDQLWFVDRTGVHRRDLLVDPQRDVLVAELPPELAYVAGKSFSYGTHITLSPDRTLIFMDARTDQVFRQGVINLKTGGWEEWGQLRFCCNHGQSSPTDPHLAMCAWEYGGYLVQDEMTPGEWAAAEIQSLPYTSWTKRPSGHLYPRIWLFRDDCAPWMVRERITNSASHEIFRPDGTGIFWCASGVTQMDLATERQSRISPVVAAHATMTRDGRYLVFDASVNGWWRGCDWTVRFWNRDAHRSAYIHNFMSRMAEQENESKLHPDPHPQFVCNDRYVVCTSYGGDTTPVNGRCMCLSVTPVRQLVELTEQMAVSNAAKRLELAGWTAGQPTGVPYEIEVDTRQVKKRIESAGGRLLASQCPQNGSEFTSYALEAVVGGETRTLPFEAVQPSGDYRYGASLRFVPPAGMTKLVLVVDPPGRYEVLDSELCANLFDRRNIRDYYPRTAAAAFAPGETPVAAASCSVGAAAGMPVKLELDVMNFALPTWWGNVRLEQFDAAGNALGSVLAAADAVEDVSLARDERLRVRKTGRLAPNAATVRLYLEGASDDGTAPRIQLQHLNLRPAYALDPFNPPSTPPTAEKGTLVVTVESGRTNAFDFAALGGRLVGNTVTNFIKRGGGTLVVGADLSRYLGDITVEAGTYAFTTNTALGKLADARTCGSVVVRDGAALDACPPATARGNDWGWFNKRILFEGEGPDGRGALVHSGNGRLARLHFSTNLVMTGDAKIANLGTSMLYQTGGNSPVTLTMRGHTLTIGRGGPVAFGCLTARWPGSIVVEDGAALTLMNSNTHLNGGAVNRLAVRTGGSLTFNKTAGDLRWTLDLADRVPVTLEDGRAGTVSTNLTYWEGPVLTGARPAALDLRMFDFTLRGPVSGAGFTVRGDALTNGRLHLVSAANAFTDGLVARNAEIWLWANGALPTGGGALAITNGAVALADPDAWYDLPALAADGTVAVRGAASGAWRKGVVKTGAGAFAWEPLAGAPTLDLRGGRISVGHDASRRGIAGLIESFRQDYPNARSSEMFAELRTRKSVFTNCVVRSPAAYYDRNHHLWTDPAPDTVDTWRCMIAYSGYIWNNAPTNETWSFAGAALTHLVLAVNGEQVFYYQNAPDVDTSGNVTMRPGPNRFDVRGYTTGPGRPVGTAKSTALDWTEADFMVGYDPLGRRSRKQSDYRKIVDPGDGSLLTWCLPDEVENGVTVPPGGEHPVVNTPVFGTMRFAAGTGADFAADAYAVAGLEGLPSIAGAAGGFRAARWTVPMDEVMAGGLLTAAGRLELGDVSPSDPSSATSGRCRLAIAAAAGGVSVAAGPDVRGDTADWRLELSADGRTLYARRRPRPGVIVIR